MRLQSLFRDRTPPEGETQFHWLATSEGLQVEPQTSMRDDPEVIGAALSSPEVASLLDQLVTEDLATQQDLAYAMSWEQVYELSRSRAYASSLPLLLLPPFLPLVPRLQSQGSLTDPDFSIAISGWVDATGRPVRIQALTGGMIRVDGALCLLPAPVWRLLADIAAFDARPPQDRNAVTTRRHWGSIRRLAVEADAVLDHFLARSIVVTPETLDIEFRRIHLGETSVVEIQPGFEGAPERWLEAFDQWESVPPHINIPTAQGAVHVAFTEPVRSVLREIKRLPGRRAAGARAEAFLLNPIAALGDDAAKVIDIDQFTAARDRAEIQFEKFRPIILRDAAGYPGEVGIEIDLPNGNTVRKMFYDTTDIEAFVSALEHRLQNGLQLLSWQEFEFELDGDAPLHLADLKAALAARANPTLIRHDRVYDLSSYYDRIMGIGDAQPFISAYIVKKSDEEGWFQKNLLAILKFRPHNAAEDVTFPLSAEGLPDIATAIAEAKQDGSATVKLPGCPTELPLDEVDAAVTAFEAAIQQPPPPEAVAPEQEPQSRSRLTLLIKSNIDELDHQETREQRLAGTGAEMERPRALRAEVSLYPHQVSGVARLQHLFKASPDHCRGVLLADDMGLGKTLQLLTFITWAFEQNPDLPAAMIVAPVSLLENWQKEIVRYFEPGTTLVLTAYGDALADLRVPRASIDVDLQKEGLVRFLKPGWRGNAKIVLTTYETLRDLEFTFAQDQWSILVCDEAQKIKNPNTMVTRAAKKLNVRFRVACTGTPVENSLTDIWCLFDMVQPGLLGALNTFGREYGRVIETRTDTAAQKLEALRRIIEPQVIRRLKKDVATNLKKKIKAVCNVEMSNEQRMLYAGALELFNGQSDAEGQAALHHLGLLQHLRLICADPRHYGIETFVPEDLAIYRRKAPKMDWLLRTLHDIKAKGEKALVFAEHRDVQRLLQHYVRAEFKIVPAIVNGDTAVSAKSQRSREKIITKFQSVPGFGVLILSPLAVGYGVNIQEANHVIHYLRHWNPAKEDQATDRAYRIGQKKDVTVYCPLTRASDFKTFDVKLDELLELKRELAGDMLEGAGAVSLADFDLRDIAPDAERTLRNDPVTLDLVERSAPGFFEALAAALWQKQGYRCQLTQQSDAGVDVVGIRGQEGILIQCKTSSSTDKQLGWEAVRDVVGGTAIYEEKYPAVRFRRIGMTNQRFNLRAHDRARASNVQLIEQDGIARLLDEHPIGRLDVLAKLAEERVS
ncbi:SNF2-related protein [Hyphomicrobium sp. LHD-15]|uniref:SNF2-related protein n=1 Tax=Hyphomicrobium sp. LHD-15 TaxID=3072142 RepID=UPI00280D81C7|nr:SNF2-related protein [Hyphomicrobium sp. LHD-15]MDQ8698160.1 SNF2-related protein [Hyphomicrobium sp. LHD-15]